MSSVRLDSIAERILQDHDARVPGLVFRLDMDVDDGVWNDPFQGSLDAVADLVSSQNAHRSGYDQMKLDECCRSRMPRSQVVGARPRRGNRFWLFTLMGMRQPGPHYACYD